MSSHLLNPLNDDEIQEAIGYFVADWECYEDWDNAFGSTVSQFQGCNHVNGQRVSTIVIAQQLRPILWEVARPLYLESHGEELPATEKEYIEQTRDFLCGKG